MRDATSRSAAREHNGCNKIYLGTRAAELYKQAAAKGITAAQTNLGILYYNGQGVPKDVARGVALLKQVAAGGDKNATDTRRELGETVPPGGAAGAPKTMD